MSDAKLDLSELSAEQLQMAVRATTSNNKLPTEVTDLLAEVWSLSQS